MPTECERTFAFAITDSNTANFIDLAQCLSAVNRRLYRQGKCYYIQKIQWLSASSLTGTNTSSKVSLMTVPYNWVSRNAWVKAFNLWKQMNKNVLDDNKSVQGKWADFKVMFDTDHYAGGVDSAGPTLNMLPFDGSSATVDPGEWYMGRYVSPQHDVNPTTGEPLDADEYYCHMLGADQGSQGAYGSVGIINGYQDTRARVQVAPDVPATMSTNWMTELTDLGGQDPELADIIEDANDAPPYDLDEYPGGATNFNGGVIQTQMICTVNNQIEKDIGFPVPFGLLKINRSLVNDDNGGVLLITLAPGKYHGVMATEVKQ
jgi:hypothetical protein